MVISDYPADEVLENIRVNVRVNIDARREREEEKEKEVEHGKEEEEKEEGKRIGEIRIQGHEWGVLTDPFSLANKESFDILLVADCLWMPWQHTNLLHSIRYFLTSSGRAWVVAGFHTGREKMRGFYAKAALEEAGLEIERIWERNAEGVNREWVEDRGIEDVTERKRWLVIGILKRKGI